MDRALDELIELCVKAVIVSNLDDRVPLGYVHPNIDVPTASVKRTLTND